jgi:hypothetical protein
MKMRVNRGQEFVSTRNGFTPATRLALFKKFAWLEIPDCTFANLPEAKSGKARWIA